MCVKFFFSESNFSIISRQCGLICQAGVGATVRAAPTGGDAPISASDEGGGVAQPRGAP
jgi:hypothetical protein